MRLSLPPLTKALLVAVFSLSLGVALLRYHTYYLWSTDVAEKHRQKLENSVSEDVGDGKNFPPDQKQVGDDPRPSHLFVPYLTIVPGVSHYYYPWIIITSSFIEESLIALVFTATTLLYGGRYCEHVWGSVEYARFVLIQTILPNLDAFLFYTAIYTFTDTPSHSLVTICGSTALVAGLLVAFKQLVPEHSVILFKGLIRIKVRNLPFAFLTLSTFMGIISSELYTIHAWTGLLTAWVYLRFIRVTYADPVLPFNHNSTMLPFEHTTPGGIKIRGDASDTFTLAEFFPEPVRFLVVRVADSFYRVFTTLHLLRPFTQAEIDAANTRALARVTAMGPTEPTRRPMAPIRGSARAEAERRRSLALRALGESKPSTPLSLTTSSPAPSRPVPAAIP